MNKNPKQNPTYGNLIQNKTQPMTTQFKTKSNPPPVMDRIKKKA